MASPLEAPLDRGMVRKPPEHDDLLAAPRAVRGGEEHALLDRDRHAAGVETPDRAIAQGQPRRCGHPAALGVDGGMQVEPHGVGVGSAERAGRRSTTSIRSSPVRRCPSISSSTRRWWTTPKRRAIAVMAGDDADGGVVRLAPRRPLASGRRAGRRQDRRAEEGRAALGDEAAGRSVVHRHAWSARPWPARSAATGRRRAAARRNSRRCGPAPSENSKDRQPAWARPENRPAAAAGRRPITSTAPRACEALVAASAARSRSAARGRRYRRAASPACRAA